MIVNKYFEIVDLFILAINFDTESKLSPAACGQTHVCTSEILWKEANIVISYSAYVRLLSPSYLALLIACCNPRILHVTLI